MTDEPRLIAESVARSEYDEACQYVNHYMGKAVSLKAELDEALDVLGALLRAWTSPKPDPTARPNAEALLARYDGSPS